MKKLSVLLIIICFASAIILLIKSDQFESNPKLINLLEYNSKTHPAVMQTYRAEHEFMKTRDPNTGKLPANIASGEQKFHEYYRNTNVNKQNSVHGPTWINRGPVNVGGRMKVLKFDVRNEDIMMAGSASGGLWRSIDGGESWMKVTQPYHEQSITALVQDTREGHRDTWYLGTGEMLTTTARKVELEIRSIGMGNGIYKSTDNGLTWSHLKSTDVGVKGSLTEHFQGIWKLVIDHTNTEKDIIYAACYGGIMRSEDGGESWELVLGDSNNKGFSSDIEIASDGTLYGALTSYKLDGGSTGNTGIFQSNDGKNWTKISDESFEDETRRIKMALAPSNEDVLYVFTEYPEFPQTARTKFFESNHSFRKFIYNESTNEWESENRTQYIPDQGGSSFNPNGLGTIGGYCMVLEVDPTDEDFVIIGGVRLWRSSNAFASKGVSGQEHFQMSSFGNNNNSELHPDVHDVRFSPSDPKKLYVACDGGIVKTENWMSVPVNWETLNNGLITTQFYSVSINNKNNMELLGGLQDNGTQLKHKDNKSKNWIMVGGGDGMDCEIIEDNIYIGSVYNGRLFYLKIIDNNILRYYDIAPNGIIGSANMFYTFFENDPSDNNFFYIPNDNEIYRHNDFLNLVEGNSNNSDWMHLNNLTLPENEFYTALCSSTEPEGRLYMGTSNGRILRVDDARNGQPDYVDITGNEFPENAYLACIEVDPRDADKVFAVFSNYNVESLFYSSDGGITWEKQGGNLEAGEAPGIAPSFRWLSVLPYEEEESMYFLATSIGLFSTKQLNGTNTEWTQESPELIGNVLVDNIDIRYSDQTVAIATQGNGIYTASFNLTDVESEKEFDHLNISNVYPNPVENNSYFKINSPNYSSVEYEIFDYNGRKVSRKYKANITKGENELKVNCTDCKPGVYILKVQTGDVSKSIKFVKR